MKAFEYIEADSLDTALKHYNKTLPIKASGIDLIDLMKEGILQPKRLLSIHRIASLRYIREEKNGLRIGALTTLKELSSTPYRALNQAARNTATPQVRERATLGGNLCQRPRCWYFRSPDFKCWKKMGPVCYAMNGENQYHAILGTAPCRIVHPSSIAPALVALRAEITLEKTGNKRTLPIHHFFMSPRQNRKNETALEEGEILTSIFIPNAPDVSTTLELREKQTFDWPIALASVARFGNDWTICLGAVAPIPWKCQKAALLLNGKKSITPKLAEQISEEALEDAYPLSDNSYKIQCAKITLKRALLEVSK